MTAKSLNAQDIGMPAFEFDISPDADVFDLSSHGRAREALALGLERPGAQYNIYVLGPDQAGRMTATRSYVEQWARANPAASDWLYLVDFEATNSPQPVAVPTASGAEIRDAVEALIPILATALAKAFAGESYQGQVSALRADGEAEFQNRSQALDAASREQGLTLVSTPQGPMVAALGEDGEPVAMQTLSPEQREQHAAHTAAILQTLAEIQRDAARAQQQFIEALVILDKDIAGQVTGELIAATARLFQGVDALAQWFVDLASDVVDNYLLFLQPEQPVPTPAPARALRRYAVNLLVDRRRETHRPVVVEQNPTYENVFGKIEYRQLPGGGLETDVSLVQGGSLHRANGGVLLLRASDMASQPGVWQYLKAALRDAEVRIEEFYRAGAPPIAGAPRPRPVPLDLTVVLVGPPALYHMFFAADPEFNNYFKVKAHIDPLVDATPQNLATYAGLLTDYAAQRGAQLEPGALRLLLGTAARWGGHRERISTRFEAVNNLIEEACADCEQVDEAAVRAAITARRRRNSQIEDEVHRAITEELTIISVTGDAIGQINGLTVQDVGDHVFGAPSRITARASVGRRGVINIERLVAMSGPIQQKGSMVLQGLLARRFARHAPTSFDCSVTFEQLYGGVEGDSASLAEYIAIISDLADLPIRQDLAITGSVNQLGEAQVIGGVQHKVEGFFRACRDVGDLTGTQGVVLPFSNERNLVLRDEVVTAIAAGEFKLFSIENVDEAVELFTGYPLGSAAERSQDTVYGRVVQTLETFDNLLTERGL